MKIDSSPLSLMNDKLKLRDFLDELISYIITSSNPAGIIEENVSLSDSNLTVNKVVFDLSRFKKICLVAYGKASVYMTNAITKILRGYLDDVYAIVDKRIRYDNVEGGFKILNGSHPLPDEDTLNSSKILLERALPLEDGDLMINLISGGGSSLFEIPMEPLTLNDIKEFWRILMSKGSNIHELNTVRRHTSEVKGGRFAAYIYPANTLSLIISDVVGDPIHDVASGPTAPDPTTYWDAYQIIKKYGIECCSNIVSHIKMGIKGKIEETPKPGSKIFQKVDNQLIGNLSYLSRKLSQYLRRNGFNVETVKTDLSGDIRNVAKYIFKYISTVQMAGKTYIFGGEAYTKVVGEGYGGPNQELALELYRLFRPMKVGVEIISFDTDGIDGNSKGAGAYIDTLRHEIKENEIDRYLMDNDSYTLLKKYGLAIETGPTGTNLNSIWIINLYKV